MNEKKLIDLVQKAIEKHNQSAEQVETLLQINKIILAQDVSLKDAIEIEDEREVSLVKIGIRLALQMLGEFPLSLEEIKKEVSDGNSQRFS